MHRATRALVYPVALVAGLATAITAAAAPALADTAGITPTTWSYVDSASPDTGSASPAGDAPVGTRAAADGTPHTYRSYFTYDLTPLRGKVLSWAWISTTEQTVDDCSISTPIELVRTESPQSELTWNNQPADLELVHRFERGGADCPSYLGWNVLSMVTAALGRNETTMTLELRIAKDVEPTVGNARTLRSPLLGQTSNYPPTVDGLGISDRSIPCGTPTEHPTGNDWSLFQATAADRDDRYVTTTFAAWPVDHPDQRKEFGTSYGIGVVSRTLELSRYFADGTVLAWSARAKDQTDASAWAQPCYLTVDRTPPSSRPTVSSTTYPQGGVGGGPGVPGKFRFDANGDRDVYGFEYTDGSGAYERVAANQPGGSAVIEYTPRYAWSSTQLTVSAYDESGNRGPTTTYEFRVRDTAPYGSVDVAGVGLPSTITLLCSAQEVTEFGYQIDGQPEVRMPAVGGRGTGQVTFARTGYFDIQVRSYVGAELIGAGKLSVRVDDEPTVTSDVFGSGQDVIAGSAGTFAFAPRRAGVVGYEVDFGNGGDVQRVDAAADGRATMPWTPTVGGWYLLRVVSLQADGTRSWPAQYQFNVIDPRPEVLASDLASWPRTDGVGLPLTIEMSSELPDLAGFAYRFNGGQEQTVTGVDWSQRVRVVPDHAGANTIVVAALLADGSRSPETSYTFDVFDGPTVSVASAGRVAVGRPATVTFTPGLPDVAEYRYVMGYGAEQTIAAGPDGTATVTYTPLGWGNLDIQVTSIGKDGTRSQTRHHYVGVVDNKVDVSSGYSESSARGGIGIPAYFTLSTQLFKEVVEYHYRFADGPEQVIAAPADGTSTSIAFTPTSNGLTTLEVYSRTASGEISPVTRYSFRVGTAPLVVSRQYPNGQWAGGAGVQGTFTFSGGTAGITAFEYRLDNGPLVTVPADGSGSASMTFTPPSSFDIHTLTVTGRLADGTATDTTTYNIYVSTAV